jgi:hypothetical protein
MSASADDGGNRLTAQSAGTYEHTKKATNMPLVFLM